MAVAGSIYEIPVYDIKGMATTLGPYRGQVMLIVNVASKCGFTPQYKGLEELYAKYREMGFVVLGFPSNEFGRQEPGTNEEIAEFCQLTYAVDFPLFAKGKVKGKDKQELYQYLLSHGPSKSEVKWNFEKFLVDRQGQVVARFGSFTRPSSKKLNVAIAKALAQKVAEPESSP